VTRSPKVCDACRPARCLRRRLIALSTGFLFSFTSVGHAQHASPREQTVFQLEVEMERPVPLPEQALRILSREKRIAICMEHDNISPKQVPASWFVASQIHLDGASKADLVVQARQERDPQLDNRCLFGANIGPFWVLRNSDRGYELVLQTDALGIDILSSRTKDYCDIRGIRVTAGKTISVVFRFDGAVYQPGPAEVEDVK
jgi:hypothetical protein